MSYILAVNASILLESGGPCMVSDCTVSPSVPCFLAVYNLILEVFLCSVARLDWSRRRMQPAPERCFEHAGPVGRHSRLQTARRRPRIPSLPGAPPR